MTIKILGMGCANCEKLEALAKQAAQELNISATFEKVKNIDKIMDYGIARTPGLVINEQVKVAGKIPSLEQIKTWIQEAT
ncbi:MAG: TM0996/MTH895 family glutaredoxin-like protein [bacterium]|nr:MAG: TM0996/MTH895 family glutaredoxin-like protein [bacterium]